MMESFNRPAHTKTIYSGAYVTDTVTYCAAIIFAGSKTFTVRYIFPKNSQSDEARRLYAEAYTAGYAKDLLRDKGYEADKFSVFISSLVPAYKVRIPYRNMTLRATEIALEMKESDAFIL